MSARPWHVSVLIPARNEEELLPRCLRSVLGARARLRFPATCNIIVAVDRSTDRTGEIAERMLRGLGIVVYTDAGAVGHARRIAACAAVRRNSASPGRHWLANTDADCKVPPDWLTRQLAFADAGFEVIAGTVDVDSFAEHGPEVRSRFHETYRIDEDGGHSHIHGANLGVRADVYRRAGGWRGLATAEDGDLWSRLARSGAHTLSTNETRILTSGRRVGRAPQGFADALAAHNETAA